ncbi:hypothetical protein ACFQZ8_01020 [Micromonospora azadirachtae]|uniref:Uncharacterized protein n=1 Tax=Micromonospora azadirachtae TaxID=1970735 RepID=A0ABW2ZV06_9ACTN
MRRDVDSADAAGWPGPTFFINGRRHDGPQDLVTLNRVIGGGTSARRRPETVGG